MHYYGIEKGISIWMPRSNPYGVMKKEMCICWIADVDLGVEGWPVCVLRPVCVIIRNCSYAKEIVRAIIPLAVEFLTSPYVLQYINLDILCEKL